jgi:hypothetical protein
VLSRCIDAYTDFFKHDGCWNCISVGIGRGVIGVASNGDPNVEKQVSSAAGHFGMSASFLTSLYSSSFNEDSSSRDNIIGVGADG